MPGTRPSTGIHSTNPAATIAPSSRPRTTADVAWARTSAGAIEPTRRMVTTAMATGGRAEANQDRVHRRRPGEPPDDVVGQPQQEHRGHRHHQDQPLGDQRGQ